MVIRSVQKFSGIDIATRKPVALAWFHGGDLEGNTGLTWHSDGTFQAGGDPHPLDIVKAVR